MSDLQTDSHSPEDVPAEGAEAIRAEVRQEYSARLARAEIRVHAAQAGVSLPDGFVEYLDASKLLGADGNPSAEAMDMALSSFKPSPPRFPQLEGVGHNRSGGPFSERRTISLDVRNR